MVTLAAFLLHLPKHRANTLLLCSHPRTLRRYSMAYQPVASPAGIPPPPSWVEMKSDKPLSAFIDWEALRQIAIAEKQRASRSEDVNVACEISAACSEGGLHIVRRLEFSNGDTWIARVQKTPTSVDSCKRLLHEVCTIGAIQQRSSVPIPSIVAYRTAADNPVGAAFTIQQYIHADTGMNVLGEGFSKRIQMTAGWEERYFGAMARIQVSAT